ncbi:hypothetical protein M404DRAFT_31095 [Pisolithus tinctorius Marx 270]|uniref:Uncharacterized protein n=1 Tax=Pisolithus tinctorius Marx 270 TaxID=870435 RepID=A0A0C3NCB8_PISTI|nr:hypothetical protein M404DRAFT_31095 [Pisolithus tinctorius Marx 270]
MSPNTFKTPNGALTPIDVPKTAETVTDMLRDLYNLVNFSPNGSPPEWAAPAAVAMPSTIDPALLSLDAHPPPDIPANNIPITETIAPNPGINFHSILTFHNSLQAAIYALDCFLAKQAVSEKVLGKWKRED